MAKRNLSASEYYRAENIFKDKGWKIDKQDKAISQYNNFLNRVSILPKDTKDFFFDLTERFENISLNEIIEIFKKSYSKIDKKVIDGARKIYFLPLICPIITYENNYKVHFFNIILNFLGLNKKTEIERPKSKSCDFILSLVKIEYRDMYGSDKFIFPTSYFKFKQQYDSEKDLVFLVDDFIGTGDTAEEVLNFYLKQANLNAKNLKIITIVSQKEGVKRINESYSIQVYSDIIKEKALSDFYENANDCEEFKNLVIKMSEAINIKQDFFGYKNSEALVCILNKSPNNTLPIFWFENKNYPAPFPRMKIYNHKAKQNG